MEILLNDKLMQVDILKKDGNNLEVSIDGKTLDFDVIKVENGIYSILHKGKSYDMEIVPGSNKRNYTVAHRCASCDVEIIDQESKYMKNRMKGQMEEDQNSISSPMPGKVVKVLVDIGDQIEPGQTLIIISAMKMESEYKAKRSGKVKEILTNEGDTIEGNQPLILIE
jgi:biotin carboxyl carrier protein